jgi:hypothetical protein
VPSTNWPPRIEDALPDIAYIRDITRLSILDADGQIIDTDHHLSPIEQARIQVERARGTLDSLGPTIYQIISDASLTDAQKEELNRLLSNGGEDARELRSFVGCAAFDRLDIEGKSKALRLFLGVDRHLIVLIIVHALSYQGASVNTMKEILDAFQNLSSSQRQDLDRLVDTGVLQPHALLPAHFQMNYDEKARKILAIFNILLPSRGRRSLIEICRYWYIIFNRDSESEYLIDSLYFLAINGIDPIFTSFNVITDDVLSSIMIECSDPGQVDQSTRGTCTVTSMQYVLCTQNPAEYVRIMKGLLSQQGFALLHNGQKLIRVNDSIPPDTTWRSTSERVFQSALMLFARGHYSNIDPENPGLNYEEIEKVIEALFGFNFEVYSGDWKFWEDQGQKILDKLKGKGKLIRTFSSLKWGEGYHMVFLTELKQGRVFLRNPWGPTSDPVGTIYNDPPRRLEDSNIRLESMTEQDFKDSVRAIVWPKSN